MAKPSGFQLLTAVEAERLTPAELTDRIAVEQQWWERKFDRGRMSEADKQGFREFRRILHTYLTLADGFDAVTAQAQGRREEANAYWDTPVGDRLRHRDEHEPTRPG